MLTQKDKQNLPMLIDLTAKLMEVGVDMDVTLGGSETTVELFSPMTGVTVGVAKAESLEEALCTILARCAQDKAMRSE